MTKREEYQLTFRKVRDSEDDIYFDCEHTGNTNQYHFFSHIINLLEIEECQDIIDNYEYIRTT